jgi:predicted ABC-type sugar transport system permease subunit
MTSEPKPQASVGELLTALARDTGTLVQKEVQLATTEMTAKTRHAARDVGVVAAGGLLAHVGVLCLAAAIIAALASVIPVWASAGVIGALAAALGYGLIRTGTQSLRRIHPAPEQTVQTLREDKMWAKEQFR